MHSRRPFAMIAAVLAASTAFASAMPVAIVPGSLEVNVAIKANIESFTASVLKGSLNITADPDAKAIDSLVYTFDWSGIKTGDRGRDRTMLEWAQAKEYPTGKFTLKSIETRGSGHVVKGSLEFHGVSRDLELPVDIVPTAAGFKVSGHVTIDYRDWGLKQFRKFLIIVVDPMVTVNFKFEVAAPNLAIHGTDFPIRP